MEAEVIKRPRGRPRKHPIAPPKPPAKPSVDDVRKRLRDDFDFYAPRALKIRTEDAQLIPLKPNQAQRMFLDRVLAQWERSGKIRAIVLKGRQQGLSTIIAGLLYWRASQTKNTKTVVLTHHSESTQALFNMTRRYHDNCPDALRPETKYASKRELHFSNLDSLYTVATAGGESGGRGETFNFVHASEVAFWPKGQAAEMFNALSNAVPDAPGTMFFVESTANGVSGVFAELWSEAVKGTIDFEPIFIPWYVSDKYRRQVPEGFVRTPEEERLVSEHGLDDEQLQWRRTKIASTSIDLFNQEYPTVPEDAFLATGRPAFDVHKITELLRSPLPSPMRYSLVGNTWEEDRFGSLFVYEEPDPKGTYYIGADVSEGTKNGDWSVAQVLNGKREQVAVYRGKPEPYRFASILAALGYYYNGCEIVVESNNHGYATVSHLQKALEYPFVHFQKIEANAEDQDTIRLGYRVTVQTKPLIIDNLRSKFLNDEIKIVDKQTLSEMRTYIIDDAGKYGAEKARGIFDDCVMSLALANHIWAEPFDPIMNEDSWYTQEQY